MKVNSVLYITTAFMGTMRYFSWISYPDIWYAKLQRKVIKKLSTSTQNNISIRFYPKDRHSNPNKENWTNNEKITILTDKLPKILAEKKFDLIITEAWATVLLEILCTKSQIIALYPQNFIRIYPDALKLLKERIFIADNEKAYLHLLEQALSETPELTPKSINDDFLFKYGIGSLTHDPLKTTEYYLREIIYEK